MKNTAYNQSSYSMVRSQEPTNRPWLPRALVWLKGQLSRQPCQPCHVEGQSGIKTRLQCFAFRSEVVEIIPVLAGVTKVVTFAASEIFPAIEHNAAAATARAREEFVETAE
jgi:hypothetical protein